MLYFCTPENVQRVQKCNIGRIWVKHKYNNLTPEERKALHDLMNDTFIIINEAEKGSVVVVWDKENYLKKAEEQLSCKEMYQEVTDDPSCLIDVCIGHWRKFRRDVILILIF